MNFQTTNIEEIRRELACDRATAEEIARHREAENRSLVAAWPARKRELLAAARKAYTEAEGAYLARRPDGKNAAKAGLRAAREVWSGFETRML
jgi:hypothetical protein